MQVFDKLVNKNLLRSAGFINGKDILKTSLAKNFDVTNPATGEVISSLPRMNHIETELAIESANDGWKEWKKTTGVERSKVLRRMANLMRKYNEDLALIATVECGKPLAEAMGEIHYATSFYDYYADEATRINGEVISSPAREKRLLTIKQPVGVAGLITPWNFPSAMITRKVGPAVAAGCAVVIKPAEQTPLSALALCSIAEEAGLPPGVMNCLTVARDEVVEVGTTLCHSKAVRKISFTGSTNVGKWLMRESASTVKRVSLELGGNAPFIVFDDADLHVALKALMFSKFRNAGQACIASNRVLVQEGVYEKFSHMVAEAASKLRCGNGLDSASNIGPLIDSNGLQKVTRHVNDCVEKGAKPLIGGKPIGEEGSLFFEPTVLVNVSREMLPYQQETFGPIIPLISFKTEEEAIEIANDTDFGLASYACTRDLSRAWRVAEALESGMVGINDGGISTTFAPFGGIKESGIGREGSHNGVDEYLENKYICMGIH